MRPSLLLRAHSLIASHDLSAMSDFPLDFTRAHGAPLAEAFFRREPEDFIVDEKLAAPPSGEGEHICVQVRKASQNTQWVAKQLAKFCGVKNRDVGYCGLKDRHALTTQWFSICLPKEAPDDWQEFEKQFPQNCVKVLQHIRHNKKLRPGDHQYNAFIIRVYPNQRGLENFEKRFNTIENSGVPNYFGEQRFGIEGGNLIEADKLFSSWTPQKHKKMPSIIISAARSYLFNLVLSNRVKHGDWQQVVDGEVSNNGAQSPNGPLWGRGRSLAQMPLLQRETEVLDRFESWREALEHCGLSQERRDLLLLPDNMYYKRDEGLVEFGFRLPPGSYATSVLREFFVLKNSSGARSESSGERGELNA